MDVLPSLASKHTNDVSAVFLHKKPKEGFITSPSIDSTELPCGCWDSILGLHSTPKMLYLFILCVGQSESNLQESVLFIM